MTSRAILLWLIRFFRAAEMNRQKDWQIKCGERYKILVEGNVEYPCKLIATMLHFILARPVNPFHSSWSVVSLVVHLRRKLVFFASFRCSVMHDKDFVSHFFKKSLFHCLVAETIKREVIELSNNLQHDEIGNQANSCLMSLHHEHSHLINTNVNNKLKQCC